MNLLNKILLAVFLLLFCFCSIAVVGQAYSADHLILQDLDTVNNLATICQDDGSLCSDVEVVGFDDLNRDQKDQVIDMIASSAIDRSSYSSTLELDQFSNFLFHSDEISYSSDYDPYLVTGVSIVLLSLAVAIPNKVLSMAFPQERIFTLVGGGALLTTLLGGSICFLALIPHFLSSFKR